MRYKKDSHGGLSRRHILKYGLYGSMAGTFPFSFWLNGCRKYGWQGKMPNIFIILIDTLRADHLGCYGHSGSHSPALDTIATEGVFFERAISQSPWTQPAIASLFSSHYPSVHKVIDYGQACDSVLRGAPKVVVFNDSFVTLAEVLRQAGYQTAAFVSNPFVLHEFGFAQGFEHFDTSFAANTTPGSVVNEATLAWLRQRNPDRPSFCFLHYMDVHGPYEARPEFLDPLLDEVEAMPEKRKLSQEEIRKLTYLFAPPKTVTDIGQHNRLNFYREYWVARYNACIREVDNHIKSLRVQLEQMGLWDDAYVIVTADHGEALLEHGHWEHGFSVHHPEVNVPLFLRWPGVLTAGKRIRGTVQLIDLMPTLIDQLKLPKMKELQGRSRTREITGRQNLREEVAAFAEGVKSGPEQNAIYLGDWKMMVIPSKRWQELYFLGDDPLEQNELSARHPQKAQELTKILQEQITLNNQLGSSISTEKVPLTPEQQNRLRSLGYLE